MGVLSWGNRNQANVNVRDLVQFPKSCGVEFMRKWKTKILYQTGWDKTNFHCMKILKLTFLKLTLCQSPWRRFTVWRLTKYELFSYHDVIIINLPKSSSLIQKQLLTQPFPHLVLVQHTRLLFQSRLFSKSDESDQLCRLVYPTEDISKFSMVEHRFSRGKDVKRTILRRRFLKYHFKNHKTSHFRSYFTTI